MTNLTRNYYSLLMIVWKLFSPFYSAIALQSDKLWILIYNMHVDLAIYCHCCTDTWQIFGSTIEYIAIHSVLTENVNIT